MKVGPLLSSLYTDSNRWIDLNLNIFKFFSLETWNNFITISYKLLMSYFCKFLLLLRIYIVFCFKVSQSNFTTNTGNDADFGGTKFFIFFYTNTAQVIGRKYSIWEPPGFQPKLQQVYLKTILMSFSTLTSNVWLGSGKTSASVPWATLKYQTKGICINLNKLYDILMYWE